MKNIKLKHLLIINLFFGLIIYFNFSDSSFSKKKYTFERIYKQSILAPENICIKVSDSTFTPVYPSHIPNTFSSKVYKNYTNYELTFYDISVGIKSVKTIQLKNDLSPIYIMKDSILSTDKFAHLNVNNNLIPIDHLKVTAVTKIKDEYLILGEYSDKKNFSYGFFKLNKSFNKLSVVDIIYKSKLSVFSEYSLKYNGSFFYAIDSEEIMYTLNKSSSIIIFKDFKLISKINTLDKTPLPNIIRNRDILVYDRSGTYNTNSASFIYKNQVHVFSNRNTEIKKVTVDVYGLEGNYIFSYILPDIANEAQNIFQIFTSNDKIIIAFENNCFSLFKIIK